MSADVSISGAWMKRALMIGLLATIMACAPRNVAQFAEPNPAASTERIYIATELELDNLGQIFGQTRPDGLNFLHVDVSIPPTHTPGKVEWPEGTPDAATDFVMTGSRVYSGAGNMISAMRSRAPGNETLVFVHGYNNTFSDAVFRFAQIRADFGAIGAGVLYSWPSAGDPRGYAYDRDSVLYSRNDFQKVLKALTRGPNDRVVILAHSLGSHLVMETLRQAAISGDRTLLNRVNGVVLMSPDIDPDVFRHQAESIGTLPQPFMLFVSRQDRALSFSSLLTGRKPRLGTIEHPNQIQGVEGVRVIDFTALADGNDLNHSVPVTSPAAISVLKGLIAQAEGGEEAFKRYMVLGPNSGL